LCKEPVRLVWREFVLFEKNTPFLLIQKTLPFF